MSEPMNHAVETAMRGDVFGWSAADIVVNKPAADPDVFDWKPGRGQSLAHYMATRAVAGEPETGRRESATIDLGHAELLPGEPPRPNTDKRLCARVVVLGKPGYVWAVIPTAEPVNVLPGGAVDDDTMQAGAIREVLEELGFNVKLTRYLVDVEEPGECGACRNLRARGILPGTHPGCWRRYYLAERVDDAGPIITDTEEIAEVREVLIEELSDPWDRAAAMGAA